ncbi:hypothetical protein AGABI2DRAFT_115277 [Agaricus bisporus var. bisporus H97]|uniref:hypothetical protein n=1 Tax=Agaricus bisporus var. bisporus (strain H97 / ATCC MYA-4626 / FGSC 10389) TaxID=936046 RepID=UPI00029F714B|nr:hypothetical protein AGABI2DRAFT_115277 [Agaricus bisporus var. bisporus H97]EKV50220.1 hypothetical protein AGABI2DRAFT_115277 [Agaricus bisporus var. bisporus H97]
MSLRTLRRHSSSLVRARAPQNGPNSHGPDGHDNGHGKDHGNGPPDFNRGGGGGPGNGNGHGHGLGNNEDHRPDNGNGRGNGDHPDSQPNFPFPGGGSDPKPAGGSDAGAGNDGSEQDRPPSTDNHESGSTNGGNTGGNSGGTTNSNSGSNPPVDATGGSSSATSSSDPQASSPSRDTASQTSDRVTQSSRPPLINAQTLAMTAVPSGSANIVSGDPSVLSTFASTPSPNPSPSPSNDITTEAALSNHDNGGAIAGGVVGAVVFVALALGTWIVYKRRRKNRLAPSAEYFSNPAAYPFARGFGGTANRSEKNNQLGSNYGGAGTGAAGKANLRSFNSESEANPQMEQYRDERPVYPSGPLHPPPQPEILYSTRPPGSPPPAVPIPGSTPGTPTTPNGRRIPFGTGTFQFPPRSPHPQPLITPQPQ